MFPVMIIPALLEMAGKIFDKVIPDKAAAEKAKMEFLAAAQTEEFSLMLEQIKVNIAEAQNPNMFVAGWRPFIGWICGSALAYTYIVLPFLQFLVYSFGTGEMVKKVAMLPTLNLEQLVPILIGMLGLGVMRTFEKVRGAEGHR